MDNFEFEDLEDFTEIKVEEPTKKSPSTPTITFDRYFLSTGRPAHHKAGMLAFTPKVKGKKTKQAWDELFKNY